MSEMIRLIVGIRDSSLSQQLQLEADLTLEKVKKSIRQWEAVHDQHNLFSGADTPNLEAVHRRVDRRKHNDPRRTDQQHHSTRAGAGSSNTKQTPGSKQSTRCGKEQHAHNKCPAKDAICHKCQKKGHYGAQCLTKNLAAASGLDTAFLDVTSLSTQESAWFADIKVGKHDVTFKLDTGAEVTAVYEKTYKQIPDLPPLDTPN